MGGKKESLDMRVAQSTGCRAAMSCWTSAVLSSAARCRLPHCRKRAARAAMPASTCTETRRPIMEGMVVLELANVLAGPSVCQFLAELGATVIKVENISTGGDVTRTWKLPSETPDSMEGDVTAYFSCCNLGKQSIAVDIRKPGGLDCVQQLVAKADVVVASYKPGDAEKLRIDQSTLRALNPKLIYAQ